MLNFEPDYQKFFELHKGSQKDKQDWWKTGDIRI